MCNLASIYRAQNKIANCGASTGQVDEGQTLTYYYYNNPGLNTFSRDIAKQRNMLSKAVEEPIL